MPFPKNADELKAAGYVFLNHAICKGCGEEIEWYETPRGKKICMNPMQRGSDPAVAHWGTCDQAPLFRNKEES